MCVNKENDTDQNALASIKLLIVVQRMAILFFWGETKGNLCQSFYTPDIKSQIYHHNWILWFSRDQFYWEAYLLRL